MTKFVGILVCTTGVICFTFVLQKFTGCFLILKNFYIPLFEHFSFWVPTHFPKVNHRYGPAWSTSWVSSKLNLMKKYWLIDWLRIRVDIGNSSYLHHLSDQSTADYVGAFIPRVQLQNWENCVMNREKQ